MTQAEAVEPAHAHNAAERLVALVALLLGASAIGAAAIFVRLAEMEGVGPAAAGFWRLVFALPLLAIWAMVEPSPKRSPAASEPRGVGWRFAVLAGLFFAGDLAFWHAGIVRTTAANATLLANLAPVVVTVFAWAVFRETITRGFLLGLGCAIAGAALLSGANFQSSPEALTGDALSALTAFWYAAYFLATKAARARLSTGAVMLIATMAGVAPLLALAVITGETIAPPTALGWVWVMALGMFAHVFGQGAIAFGLGRLPAARSAIVVSVQPVVAALLGLWLFQEAIGPWQVAGGGLVLAGVVIAQRMGASRRSGQAAEAG